jgi:predicted AAA+ superfamily ATPase
MRIERRLRASIEARLKTMPAVILLGPRQVGKTTLAQKIAATRGGAAVYLDLEPPADRRRMAVPDTYMRAQAGKLVSSTQSTRARSLWVVAWNVAITRT